MVGRAALTHAGSVVTNHHAAGTYSASSMAHFPRRLRRVRPIDTATVAAPTKSVPTVAKVDQGIPICRVALATRRHGDQPANAQDNSGMILQAAQVESGDTTATG